MNENPKNPLSDRIARSLQSELTREGMELVDLIAVPTGADRMVRFRTIQEVLSEFESGEDVEANTYVLHIRKQRAEAAVSEATAQADAIYLANGKLNGEFLANNAKILFLAGDYPAARQIYLALTKSGERTAEALLGLARCFEAEGNIEKSLKAYDDSILYSPSIDAYRRYASLLIRSKRDQQAAEVLERANLMKDLSDKHRYDLHQATGNAWLRAQVPAKAERHYRLALDYNPHSDAVATNLGTLCLQQKRFDEAQTAFEESLRVNPRNERAWFGMGSVHLTLGRKKPAHDAFAESLRLKIQQPQAIFHLVKCAYEIKEYATARGLLRSYVEMSPFNANLLYSLAGLEYHLGDRLASARTARTILQIQPAHAEAAKLLGLIEKKL
jgi:tetratricopeptide (TPR) repeat protein